MNISRAMKVVLIAMGILSGLLLGASPPETPPHASASATTSAPPKPPAVELITNGDFEFPVTPTGNILIALKPGAEPAGFGWRVVFGDVDIVRQGYDSGGGIFNGAADSGKQWLDLDGSNAGTIEQTIVTTPGTPYTLSFAFANSPYPGMRNPFKATVIIKDTAKGFNLIEPIEVSHTGSDLTDNHWGHTGAINFTAKSPKVTIQFVSHSSPRSADGVLLDNVSVKATASAPPISPLGPPAASAPNPGK